MIEQLERRIAARTLTCTGLAASLLEERLSLTATEMLVAWLVSSLAMSVDARSMLVRAIGEPGPELTLNAIKVLIYGELPAPAALAELSAQGTLRRLGIIERSDTARDANESRCTWTVSRRGLALLHGDNALDPSLVNICRLDDGAHNVDDLVTTPDTVLDARKAMRTRGLVIVSGIVGLGRRTLLSTVAQEAGIAVLEVDSRRLSKDSVTIATQLRTLAFECKLRARVPLITNLDALVDEKENRLELVGTELVAQLDGLVLATCGVNRPAIRWDRPTIVIEMGQPTSEQRGKLWLKELGEGSASDAELLATRYPLAPALIHRAAEAARARAAGQPLTPEDIHAGIRTVLDDRLGQFAKRVGVTQTWDDLVLPQEQVDSIVELMARVRGRRRVYEQWGFAAKVGKGLGVSALFSGPPGTGKTMVAALIARDLGLELYQVDLGKVVSKWIGETEKNLAALFDAAEAGHAILLFDEADSLFGKRTEVKSSNDRHANLETNYLLQRLEAFTGICLLTSNHESNIDPAFQRRLSLHLRFELPDAEEREHLWRAMLPEAAPVAADLDVESLARRFAMSGGYIRNAALRAAFLAADEDSEITGAHLERAARLEYEGLGKIAA